MPDNIEGSVSKSAEEREFFIDNLLVRIHLIIVMIRWTGLAPWEFEFPFPDSLTSKYTEKVRQTLSPEQCTLNLKQTTLTPWNLNLP